MLFKLLALSPLVFGQTLFEEFSDLDNWTHILSSGWVPTFYQTVDSRENSWVKDGQLHIRPTFNSDPTCYKGADTELHTKECDGY